MTKKLWQKKPQDLSKDISVVIITKDRAKNLVATLRKLFLLPEKFPVIVVDNNSSDNTSKIVSEHFSKVNLISLNKNLGSGGRNIGVNIAKTPLVAFCDDDSSWAPFSLTNAVNYFNKYPKLAILQSKILVNGQVVDKNCLGMSQMKLKTSLKLPGPLVLGFLACGAVARKKALLQTGGFNSRFGVGGEEGILSVDLIKQGWGVAYVSDIVSYHFPSGIRNLNRRRQIQARNMLWFVWLRRPLSVCLNGVFRYFKNGFEDPNIWVGLMKAMAGIVWIIKERKVVPKGLEANLKDFYH